MVAGDDDQCVGVLRLEGQSDLDRLVELAKVADGAADVRAVLLLVDIADSACRKNPLGLSKSSMAFWVIVDRSG